MDNKTIDLKIAELNRIKKQNALYKKLSPAERRVAVAKDALLNVQKDFWNPLGGYVYVNLDEEICVEHDMCSWLPGNAKCQVCARGALFLGALNKFNSWNPHENHARVKYGEEYFKYIDPESFGDVEKNLWSSRQIAEIEYVFELERLGGAVYQKWNNDEVELVKQWGKRYNTPKSRLIAILKNIIRNKGTFKMNDKKDIGK
jgi:hypothetical protein